MTWGVRRTVIIPQGQWEAITALVENGHAVSYSEVVRRAVDEYLLRKQKERKSVGGASAR